MTSAEPQDSTDIAMPPPERKPSPDLEAFSRHPLTPLRATPRRRIFVASAWTTRFHDNAVSALGACGHDVVDYRAPEPGETAGRRARTWADIDPDWKTWSPAAFLDHLVGAPELGICVERITRLLSDCDTCVLLLPSGRSSHVLFGMALAMKLECLVVLDQVVRPELMYQAAHGVFVNFHDLQVYLGDAVSEEATRGVGPPAAGQGDQTPRVRDWETDRETKQRRRPMDNLPKKRHLDGLFIRVRDTAGWENRCLTDLPWQTLEQFLDETPTHRDFERRALKHLHERLRMVGDQQNIYGIDESAND